MNLEDQVTSLELSKRLKELTVKQESVFVWEYFNDTCYGLKYIPFAVVPFKFNDYQLYSAFTVAELGDILPASISPESGCDSEKPIIIQKSREGEFYIYGRSSNGTNCPIFCGDNEANTRAKMLIYLIENKLIEIKQEKV